MIKQLRKPKINSVKQEFEVLTFDKDALIFKISDFNNQSLEAVCLDITCKDREIKRGQVLTCLASKRKIKFYNNKVVITHILNVSAAIQSDLEQFLNT